jgi:Na+/melibiose symporter-like transporter
MIGVRAGSLLHDAVGAHLRAGVSSGAATLSWLMFLPVAVLFGQLSRAHGVQTAGLLLVLLALAAAVLLAITTRRATSAAVDACTEDAPDRTLGPVLVAS